MEEATAPIDWASLEFLTPEEASGVLGVTPSQVHALVSGNHLPSFRVGGKIRLERREVDAYREVAASPALSALARVRRARARSVMMVERRLPFDVRGTPQNRFCFNSKHMPKATSEGLRFTPPTRHDPRQLLTLDEAAERLKVSKPSLSRLLHGRRIGFFRVGRFIRIDQADLESYLASVRYEVVVR